MIRSRLTPLFQTVGGVWKILARSLGNFQARLVLSLFYLALVTPFAVGVKLLSDPLRLKGRLPFGWLKCERGVPASLEAMRKQF